MGKFNVRFKNVYLILLLFIIISLLSIIYFFNVTENQWQQNVDYSFNGIVEKVNYDIKGIPDLFVNGKEYYLSSGYNFNYLIEKGDTLIKHKGITTYILVKHNSGKIIRFNN